jgi:hypothetical protein
LVGRKFSRLATNRIGKVAAILASRDFSCWQRIMPFSFTRKADATLALRQSEGLIGSVMKMLEIDLPVPDHTTLSRQACGLPVCNLARIGTGELHLIVDSTGLKLRGAGKCCLKNMARQSAALGASCTLALTPATARSSPLT